MTETGIRLRFICIAWCIMEPSLQFPAISWGAGGPQLQRLLFHYKIDECEMTLSSPPHPTRGVYRIWLWWCVYLNPMHISLSWYFYLGHWAPVCSSSSLQSFSLVAESPTALAMLLGRWETLYWPVTPSIDGSVIILNSSLASCMDWRLNSIIIWTKRDVPLSILYLQQQMKITS